MKKLSWKAALGIAVAVAGAVSGPAGLALVGAKIAGAASVAGTVLAGISEALFDTK